MSNTTVQMSFPTTVDFGVGTIHNLPRWIALHGTRALLVTDPGLAKLPVFDTVRSVLDDAEVAYEVYTAVSPNPLDTEAHDGAEFLRDHECDVVIGLGGGSALDGAKAIALMARHQGHIVDYDDATGGYDRIHADIPPIIAIPTTAGTGSEVGRSTVVIDTKRNVKVVVFSPYLMPRVALVDPGLHVGMPDWLTAATGMDALTHNVEALLSLGYHPLADSIALGGIVEVSKGLVRAVENGDDLEARAAMAMAALMGATAFQKGLGVIHSLAHPCSTIAGVHHGLANGVLIETGLRFNRGVSALPLAQMARTLGLAGDTVEAQADAAIEWVVQLRDRIDIPQKLADVGVTETMLPAMIAQAIDDGCHQCNPRPVTKDDIAALYRSAL